MGRGTEAIHFLNAEIPIDAAKYLYSHFSPKDAALKARREYKASLPKKSEPRYEQSELDL